VLASQVQTIREFAYAGQFPPTSLVIAGVVLGGCVVALTWWELRRNRPRLTPVLAILRVTALAVVLWMLAEPVTRTTVRRTQPKTVTFMADASASMGIVDPVQDQAEAIRWASMQDVSVSADLLSGLDAAALEIAMTRDLFAQSVEAAAKQEQVKTARESFALVGRWVDSADKQLRASAEHANKTNDACRQNLRKISSTWHDLVAPTIRELADDLDQGRWSAVQSQSGRTEQVRQIMNQAIADLRQLASQCAEDLGQQGGTVFRQTLERHAQLSRREKLNGFLEAVESAVIGKIARQVEVLRYGFDSQVFSIAGRGWSTPLSADRADAGQHTDLTAPLTQVEQDSGSRTTAAVVLFTDGAHNVDADPVKRAASLTQTPVYIVPLGNTKPVRDVMLHHAQAPRSVFQNNLVVIEAMLDAQDCAGERLEVELLENDEVVDRQTIVVSSDAFFTPLSFKRKAERAGMNEYHLRTTPVAEERTKENNQASLRVEVTEGKIRVFLADQLPRWEFRYLRNLFKRDERIEFESLLLDPVAAGGRPGETVGIPNSLDGWSRYRVVILGDIAAGILTPAHQEQLKEYVSARGGTLVLIAGDTAMPSAYLDGPLGAAMPVEPAKNILADRESFHVVVTAEGRTTDVTQVADDTATSDQLWAEHVEVHRLSEYSLPRQTAHIWLAAIPGSAASPAGTEISAFLCWQQYGQGRVVYLAAPVTYRLRYRFGDLYHNRFWGQLMRWCVSREIGSGSTTVRLVTDKTHYQSGEDVPVTVRLSHPNGQAVGKQQLNVVAVFDGSPQATVAATEETDAPGVYHATLKALPTGSITIRAESPIITELLAEEHFTETVETQVVIEPPVSMELRSTRCNLPLLTQMAATTGGAVIPPTALPAAIAMLDLSPQVTEEVSQQALWPRWTYLALFIGSLGIEWILRKVLGVA